MKKHKLSTIQLLILAGGDPRKRYLFLFDAAKTCSKIEPFVFVFDKRLLRALNKVFFPVNMKPEVIISVGGGAPGLMGLFFSKIIQKPFIIRLGGDPISSMEQIINNKKKSKKSLFFKYSLLNQIDLLVYRMAQNYFVVNEYSKKQLEKYKIFKNKNIFVQPQFRSVSGKLKINGKKLSRKKELEVLTVSNFNFLEKFEGVRLLLGYVNYYSKKYLRKIRFTICGDGDHHHKLNKLLNDIDHEFLQVLIKGYQKDLNPFYESADVFLYCSTYDGMPNVILEALGYRVPVLVNDSDIYDGILIDGETGNVFQRNNPENFSHKLHRIINEDPYREKIVEKGFDLIKSKYSKKMIGQTLHKNLTLIKEKL